MHVIKQNPKGETEEKGRDSYEKMDENDSPMMVAAMALTACGGNDAADDSAGNKVYHIGIIQQLEHPALDQATKGFEDKLTELLGIR